MRSVLITVFLLLTTAAFAQSFRTELTQKEPPPAVTVHLVYVPDPDFITTPQQKGDAAGCWWYVFVAEKDKEGRAHEANTKPELVSSQCSSLDYTFRKEGLVMVELVVNGREKKYQHLSIEQKRIDHVIQIQPRVVIDPPR